MGTLWQDIKYGLRMLVRSPGFTVVVVVILAVGIGATTVMLSVIDAVMLRACPYRDPDTLVCVWESDQAKATRNGTSYASFQDWQQRSHVFEHLIGAAQHDCRVQSGEKTEKTRALYVSPGFFSVLGAQPVLGRTFLPEEERRGGERVAILSYTHWQHWFGGDPNVIGRTLTMDRQVYTVVGVLPSDFRWVFQGWACGLWMPMALAPDLGPNRHNRRLVVIGRLKPGTVLAQAQAEMDVIAAQLAQEYPDAIADEGIRVTPINEDCARVISHVGKPRTLLVALGLAASVLLIACLHVASLLIARSASREQEIAVRAALGAHRLRLVRQMLTESTLLAACGGLLGLVLAYWAIQILSVVRGQSVPWYLGAGSWGAIPWFVQAHLDGRALLYVAGISLLACASFGILPAVGASALNLGPSLSAGRTPAAGPRFQCLRAILVAADIAIAFVLLVGAGLLISSYARVLNIEFGYRPDNVLTAYAALYDMPAYEKSERQAALVQDALQRIRRLPGVRLAGTGCSPVGGTGNRGAFKIEGIFSNEKRYRMPDWDERLPGKSYLWFPLWRVSPDCFPVLQVPLRQGRYFTAQDTALAPPVAIVSEDLARRFWPNGNCIGQYITQALWDSNSPPIPREIVGVVATVTHLGRSEPTDQEVYIPELQSGGPGGELALLVRTDPGRPDVAAAVRKEILAADPEIVLQDFRFLNEEIADFFAPHRLTLLCLGGFALVGLVLACMGVYGTTAYAVSRRTHEIGIRMALGARRGDVLKAVLRQGLTLTCIGLVIGLAGALAATRVIRSLLYDVSPADPLTFVCVGLLLAGVALLACYLPARRAARIDPMVALRYE
jgi:putative ABC transport system permease protein